MHDFAAPRESFNQGCVMFKFPACLIILAGSVDQLGFATYNAEQNTQNKMRIIVLLCCRIQRQNKMHKEKGGES